MSNKLYSETAIQNIASSIRGKNGTQNSYTVSQMAQAILDIPTGGQSYNNGKNNFWVYISEANTFVTATVETSGDTIDWGDGTVDTNTSHTYANAGVYIISADSLSNVSGGNIIYVEYNNAVTLPAYTSNTSLMKVKLNNSSFTTLTSMFNGNTGLQIADIPYITTIGNNAFQNCTSLNIVNAPNATTIDSFAFYNCNSLTSFDFSKLTTIKDYSFAKTGITTVTLPSTITSFGTTASASTFSECASLTTININCNIPTSTNGVFYKCTALQTVTVGANVTALGDNTFGSCNNTYVLHLQGTTPPVLANTFSNLGSTPSVIYVPASAVETYKTDSNWSTYASIIQAEPVGE